MTKMLKPGYIPLTEEISRRMMVFRKVNGLSVTKLSEMLNIPKHRFVNAETLSVGSIHKSILDDIANLSDIKYPCTPEYFYKFDNTFIERLPFRLFAKAIRVYLGLNESEMSDKIGISKHTYGNKEVGWSRMNGKLYKCEFDQWERDKFNSIWEEILEDLEGYTDYESDMVKYGDLSDMPQFMRDIQKLRIDRNLSVTDFMKSIGRSPAMYHKWLDQTNPTEEDIRKINELYGTNFTL